MFIELHNTDGAPFLLNLDEIESVRQGDGDHAVISLRGVTYGNVISQESYEELCNALRSLIITTKADRSGALEIWKRFVLCEEPAKVELGFNPMEGPGD